MKFILFLCLLLCSLVRSEDKFIHNGQEYSVVGAEDVQKFLGFLLVKSINKEVVPPSFNQIKANHVKLLRGGTGRHIISSNISENVYYLDVPVKIGTIYHRFFFKFTLTPMNKATNGEFKDLVSLFKGRSVTQYFVWSKTFGGHEKRNTIALKTRKKHLVEE